MQPTKTLSQIDSTTSNTPVVVTTRQPSSSDSFQWIWMPCPWNRTVKQLTREDMIPKQLTIYDMIPKTPVNSPVSSPRKSTSCNSSDKKTDEKTEQVNKPAKK